MDLVYVPEVLTYGFFRAPQYRDYEQPWNKDYFNHGKAAQVHSPRLPQHNEQKLLSKDNCYLCRENKRRSLAAYIRGKSRRSSCHEIHEEDEEEKEEAKKEEKAHDGENIKEGKSTESQILKEVIKSRKEDLKNNHKSYEIK